MKKILLLLFFCLCFFSIPYNLPAQNDTAKQVQADTTKIQIQEANEPDNEFNLFLITFAIAFFTAISIAAFIGTISAIAIILIIFLLISAGILSSSFLIGLYKKSFASGFKALLLITGSLTGILLGIAGLWIGIKIFELNLSLQNALWIGAAGGCIGGMLMGYLIFRALQLILLYAKKKFKLPV